jgi:hypothetical protein
MSPNRQKIFLSYARNDDESFVKRLYNDLNSRNFEVWWDRENMPSRSLTFTQEIRDAICKCDRLIAVIGPCAIVSGYVRYEWDHALLFCKGVVPILRQGSHDQIPTDLYHDILTNLKKYHCPDFRNNDDYNRTLLELVRILNQPVADPGTLFGFQPLPPYYQHRKKEIAELGRIILEDTQSPVIITAHKKTSMIHGMGGSGKTVLASAFAQTIDVRRSFGDGVFWFTLGKKADIISILKEIGSNLKDDFSSYWNVTAAANRLSMVLKNRRCLIVLDDIWDINHVYPFMKMVTIGSRSRLLVTTRNLEIATFLGAQEYRIDFLDNDTSLRLLAEWAGCCIQDLPAEASEIVQHCGNLPLALSMTGALLRNEPINRWKDILYKYQNAKIDKIKSGFSNEQYPYDSLLAISDFLN